MYGKHHTEEALEKIRNHAATRKNKIAQLDKDTLEIINIYDGIKDAEKALNDYTLSRSSISMQYIRLPSG